LPLIITYKKLFVNIKFNLYGIIETEFFDTPDIVKDLINQGGELLVFSKLPIFFPEKILDESFNGNELLESCIYERVIVLVV
jgi:hypothetical protein